MMERLWGDNFFDPATRKWSKKHTGTDTCKYDPVLSATRRLYPGQCWHPAICL